MDSLKEEGEKIMSQKDNKDFISGYWQLLLPLPSNNTELRKAAACKWR